MKESILRKYIQKVIRETRNVVDVLGLDIERLPRWVRQAEVRVTTIGETNVFYFKSSIDKDIYEYYQSYSTDIGLFFDVHKSHPYRSTITHPGNQLVDGGSSFIRVTGELSEDDGAKIIIKSIDSMLYDTRYVGYHAPSILSNLYVQVERHNKALETAFIPMCLYIHDSEFQYVRNHLTKCVECISKGLLDIHNSKQGDYYESQNNQRNAYLSRMSDSVVVLGEYDDGKRERELRSIRDYIRSGGYTPALIKDLPGHPAKSLPHKVKTWAMTSMFCVVVDREASGHLVEYSDLSSEEIIIALLRPKDEGSTFMIGHEHLTDNYIELFEFEESPLEVVDEAINWAENMAEKRAREFDQYYDWR